MWVKGSGGDLGTLTEAGLAVLRLDRLRALTDVYPGLEREDEMVAAFDYCLHGKGGAAPSIDTAMHGLVDAAHVDHLHPDSGIALACAADGEKLTAECFGEQVVWVPWRRPGFQLPGHRRDQGRATRRRSAASWAATASPRGATPPRSASATASSSSARPRRSSPSTRQGRAVRPGRRGVRALGEAERRDRAARLAPLVRGLASADRPQVGHFTDSDVVLDFLARAEHPRLAALGTSRRTTSCARRSARSSSTCRPRPNSTPSRPG